MLESDVFCRLSGLSPLCLSSVLPQISACFSTMFVISRFCFLKVWYAVCRSSITCRYSLSFICHSREALSIPETFSSVEARAVASSLSVTRGLCCSSSSLVSSSCRIFTASSLSLFDSVFDIFDCVILPLRSSILWTSESTFDLKSLSFDSACFLYDPKSSCTARILSSCCSRVLFFSLATSALCYFCAADRLSFLARSWLISTVAFRSPSSGFRTSQLRCDISVHKLLIFFIPSVE